MNPESEILCQGKTCFDTYALARKIARLSSQRREHAIVPFRCEVCGKWHNGTSRRMANKYRNKRR